MTRSDREKRTLWQMATIYCRQRHKTKRGTLCPQCRQLVEYACARIDHCPKGDDKTSCRRCDIHCYAPEQRKAIRRMMAYVGPRMIFYHPVASIRHLIRELG